MITVAPLVNPASLVRLPRDRFACIFSLRHPPPKPFVCVSTSHNVIVLPLYRVQVSLGRHRTISVVCRRIDNAPTHARCNNRIRAPRNYSNYIDPIRSIPRFDRHR